jgi:Domain of unknown function (DUF4411)
LIYLFDANTLIQAKNEYYPIEHIPQFWDWIVEQGNAGHIKIPYEIFDEIAAYTDDLSGWITQAEIKSALLLDETVDPALLQMIMKDGYEFGDPAFTETDVEKIGRDAFLIAYAAVDRQRTVVTKETSSPKKRRGNRKIPDVCDILEVPWTRDFVVYRALGFSLARK